MSLPPRPPLVELPGGVFAAGLALDDYEAAVQAAAGFGFAGLPQGAVLKRRAEFLAGRLAAVQALRALGVVEPPGRRDDGSPSWPAPAVGSISHGAGRALCIVGKRSEFRSLGIDAERVLSPDSSRELRARICTDRERAVLGAALGLGDHELVSLAFSGKESLYKCLYPLVGRYMEFHAAEVVSAAVRARAGALRGELTLELRVDWSASFRAGHKFAATFAATAEHVETAVVLEP
jgi:enterobactin synthetase component D